MGRGRRARQRRNRKQRRAALKGHARRLEVSIDEFELARAHDGPFRGRVEPRLLIGAYHVRGGRAALVGRALCPIEVTGAAPLRVKVERDLLRATVIASSSAPADGMFVVLVLALEEDSGRDVQVLYAALEQPALWAVWEAERPVPEPRLLHELAQLEPSAAPVAERVQVLFGESHLPASSDELIGTLMVRVAEGPVGRPSEWRFHFQSPDGKNDWTAVLRIRVTGR